MRLLFLSVLAFLSPAYACLWDSDTLAAEAKGLPGTLEIITGRFERNPPLFYEMRLKRVTQEITTQLQKLELYDDAGVACDRLHKGDEAIAWMAKKRAHLRPFPQDKEHWYRYHANLGTFQAHRWLRSGADRKKLHEVKSARDNIKRAIQINPDAHFGREKYQLMAMEWIIKPPKGEESKPGFVDFSYSGNQGDAAEAVKGLSGLIVLGNAWESIDVFTSLGHALSWDEYRGVLAYTAALRAKEMVDAGKRSLAPKALAAVDLKISIGRSVFRGGSEGPQAKKKVEEQFAKLRAEAEDWNNKRTAYMIERIKQGRHPDTDSTFWAEWKDYGPPSLTFDLTAFQWIMLALRWVPRLLLLGLAILLWRTFHRRRPRATA